MQNILLLSIRPQYAVQLFNGTKTVELRKVRPKLESGDIVVVYVSSPVKQLSGLFEVQSVLVNKPNRLWEEVKDDVGITKEEFNQYYRNSSVAYGILLERRKTFNPPVSLEDLRKKWSNFTPPQSYHYLSEKELERLESIVENNILLKK